MQLIAGVSVWRGESCLHQAKERKGRGGKGGASATPVGLGRIPYSSWSVSIRALSQSPRALKTLVLGGAGAFLLRAERVV